MALYGNPQGREYFSFLLIQVTDNSLSLALAITLRLHGMATWQHGIPVISCSPPN